LPLTLQLNNAFTSCVFTTQGSDCAGWWWSVASEVRMRAKARAWKENVTSFLKQVLLAATILVNATRKSTCMPSVSLSLTWLCRACFFTRVLNKPGGHSRAISLAWHIAQHSLIRVTCKETVYQATRASEVLSAVDCFSITNNLW
jgi:hypothetical protein